LARRILWHERWDILERSLVKAGKGLLSFVSIVGIDTGKALLNRRII